MSLAPHLSTRTSPGASVQGSILLVIGPSPGASTSLMRAVAERLRRRYNIVAILFAADDTPTAALEDCFNAGVYLTSSGSYPDANHIVTDLLATHPIDYALVTGAGVAGIIRALIDAFIPVVSVLTAFEATASVGLEMVDALDWSTTLIFTDATTADAACLAHPPLARRKLHVVRYPTPELAELSATRQLTARAAAQVEQFARRLDDIGHEAVAAMLQRARDFATLRDDPVFDADIFLPPETVLATREEAIVAFLARWNAAGNNLCSGNFFLRRPFPGFHPQIYAHENADRYDTATVNPLAHWIQSGSPDGPWRHTVITPSSARPVPEAVSLRIAVHTHFYYPELSSG